MAAPKRPDLSSRQLHCVVALARYGSFVAAAADLGLSQPALTRAIMRIEQTLGVRLFTRSTRRVALTAAGREFVPVAERLIADLDIGIQNMHTLGTRQRGRLVIASLMSVAYGLLPGIIAAYRARYISVDLELREGVLSAVTEDVRSGLADFGIGDVTNTSTISAAIEAEALSDSAFRVVLPAGHPLARKRSLRMGDLRGESIIAMPFGAGMRRSIDSAAAAAGIAFDRTITVSQFATIFKLVQAGSRPLDRAGAGAVVGRLRRPGFARTPGAQPRPPARPAAAPRSAGLAGRRGLHRAAADPSRRQRIETGTAAPATGRLTPLRPHHYHFDNKDDSD